VRPGRRATIATTGRAAARAVAAVSALALAAWTTPALCAPILVAPALQAQDARRVVDEVAALVAKDYALPQRRPAIVKRLRDAQAAKRYEGVDTAQLAARLTEDLFAASNDRHMYVNYDPPAYEGLRAAKTSAGDDAYADAVARRHNQGYEEQRILSGNVRYVRISGFYWTDDVTPRVIDDAARFLAGGDAAVIDLRGNGGGDGDAVHRMIAYFMKSDGRVLMTYHDGLTGTSIESRVPNDLPGPRMIGKPLYVLIDRGTGSAAEEFAYQVAQFKLGTLIGHTTAGAGNNNTLFPIAPGFVASISTGIVTHPVSKTNWEGKGVPPDVDVAAATALDEAHLRALRALAEKAPADQRAGYAWDIAGAEARLKPVALGDDALAAYAGRYGIRTVRVENHALVFQRDGREPIRLIPLAPDLFAFEGNDTVRVRFRRSAGRVAGFDQITRDGQTIPSDRTQ
jgi:Peptidase family S41/N-terminal domain of Peptidase_S41 in eukaryotic IRBP